MLSRVADSLYWMSRYIERAENTARLLDVNLHLMLDFEGLDVQDNPEHWLPLIQSNGVEELFDSLYKHADNRAVVEFLTFNPANPDSILSCIADARENARMVRDQVPSDMWEIINNLYHKLRSRTAESIWSHGPAEFFEELKSDSLLFQGLAESTFTHDQGYKFMQTGKFLERADQTSRILDTKNFLPNHPDLPDAGGAIDIAQWTAVLRSCSAFEAYHREYVEEVQAHNVADFLILAPTFPRSLRFCIGALDYHLRSINQTASGQFSNRAEQLCGRMRSEINYTTIDEIFSIGLHEFIDGFQLRLIELHKAVLESYVFNPEVVQTGSRHSRSQQQQQQQ